MPRKRRLSVEKISNMTKRSHKNSQKNKKALASFRYLTTTKVHPLVAISSERNSVSISAFNDLIKTIRAYPQLRKRAFSPEFPSTPAQLEEVAPLFQTTIEREFRWAASYLIGFAQQINTFLILSDDFQQSILLSDYPRCETVLNDIEHNFGFSLWYVKNKTAYLQLSHGLESQKSFINSIREQVSGTTAIIAYFVSFRNETTVTSSKYFETIDYSILSHKELPETYRDYLSFHIAPNIDLSISEIHNILSHEGVRAVIDYYETLISLCQIAVSSQHKQIFPVVLQTLEILRKSINDSRIEFLLFELKGETKDLNLYNSNIGEVLEYFLEGNFMEAYKISRKSLMQSPGNFDLLEMTALTANLANESLLETQDSLVEKLLSILNSIMKKKVDVSEELANLLKISLNFYSFSWGQALAGFYWKQRRFFPPILIDKLERFIYIANSSLNPFRINYFPKDSFQLKYIEACKYLSINTTETIYCDALMSNNPSQLPDQLSVEHKSLIVTESFVREEEFTKAISNLNNLINSSYDFYRHQGLKLKIYCLLKLAKVKECLELLTATCISNPSLINIFPIIDIVDLIDKNLRKELSGNISLPLIFDIYSKNFNNNKDNVRNYSYEDFLFANDVRRPSELQSKIQAFDKEKIIYFLRYVCVEPIMDESTVFSGSRDVTEERLKVCRLLVEIDPKSTEVYRSEIRTLLKRLMVQEKIKEIEQSKIYVDVDGIKKKVEKTMKESFDRYISFRKNNISFRAETRVIEAVKLANEGNIDSLAKISLPQNEMNDIFERMVAELRDEFVSSNVHGLDGYLSLRIRHGTLEGQLRKPLEDAQLITERESTTGLYKNNLYWVDHLQIYDDNLRVKIVNRFASFAGEFDALVQEIKNDWIQINKNPEDKGLFNFLLTKIHTAYYSEFTSPETTFEEFLDYLFNEFFRILYDNLVKVRNEVV